MTNSVKNHILSQVFDSYVDSVQVKPNRHGDGFAFTTAGFLDSFVFERLCSISDYLKEHKVLWYVTSDSFDGYKYDLPCVRFMDDVEE